MAVETFTLTLPPASDGDTVKIKGTDDPNVADENNTQIVTVLDGGDLGDDDNDGEGAIYEFSKFGKGTPTEPGEGPGGDDQFLFDLSGFDDDFSITMKSFDSGDQFCFENADSWTVVGNIWTIQYTGSDGDTHTVTVDAESSNGTGVATICICFAAGTLIAVPDGRVAIEDLAPGDMVLCGDGTARPIRWIGMRRVPAEGLRANPSLRPIKLQPDAIDAGQPDIPLWLSPQHRVLLKGWRAELYFGDPEVLAPAVALLNDKSVTRDHSCEDVTYYHILLDGHHTVLANGLECESLYPGDVALSTLEGEARDEIFSLYPELAGMIDSFGPLCHRVLKHRELKVLQARF